MSIIANCRYELMCLRGAVARCMFTGTERTYAGPSGVGVIRDFLEIVGAQLSFLRMSVGSTTAAETISIET
jgi:antitoxin component HigA of HigAB toxin-antitoxin module